MTSVYELKQQQQELIDSLYWIAEDNEEADVIKRHLLVIEGTIERKLSFLSDVLAESTALSQLATERRKIAAERLERKEAQAQRAELKLREFILSVMHDFNILKVEGEILNISRYERDAIVQTQNFNIEKIDERFLKVTKSIDKKLVNDSIKSGEKIEGFDLIKKDCIRIS
jgi:hypothetical protein